MTIQDEEYVRLTKLWEDGEITTREYHKATVELYEDITLLTKCGAFDTTDCMSLEDLWKIVEQEQEKK